MTAVLTKGSSFLCDAASAANLHGGTPGLQTSPKLKVLNEKVVIGLRAVTGCRNAPPPQGATPCAAVTIISGRAAKLKVAGLGVLLADLNATTVGPPAGKTVVQANQTKLNAI